MFGTSKQKRDSDTDGLFQRLRRGLDRTRSGLLAGLSDVASGKHVLDPAHLEEIETSLIMADIGVESTQLALAASLGMDGAVLIEEAAAADYPSIRERASQDAIGWRTGVT